MKPSVFEAFTFRLKLLRINTVNTWKTETAYFGDAWGNVMSTVVFTLTYLVFISVIYSNVQTLAGYTHDQMLLLLLINQISFYSLFVWSFNNVVKMVKDVNLGSLDLLLVKPIPALFYTSTRSISLLSVIRDGLPATIFVVIAINWQNVSVSPAHFLLGFVTFIAGQLALNGFIFMLAMPVFWSGQASNFLALSYPFMSVNLPYEGLSASFKTGLTLVIPVLVPASLTASVMLNKSNPVIGTAIAIAAAVIFMSLKSIVWKKALANYTSASS